MCSKLKLPHPCPCIRFQRKSPGKFKGRFLCTCSNTFLSRMHGFETICNDKNASPLSTAFASKARMHPVAVQSAGRLRVRLHLGGSDAIGHFRWTRRIGNLEFPRCDCAARICGCVRFSQFVNRHFEGDCGLGRCKSPHRGPHGVSVFRTSALFGRAQPVPV